MTDDSALWQQAQKDYYIALGAALKSWREREVEFTAESIQAAAATIMLHHKYLAEQERIHVKVSPASVPGDAREAPQSVGEIPSCPQCGGSMDSNPNKAKNEKAPDYVCAQENGKCGKPSKDGKYFNKTGVWAEKPNPNGAQGLVSPPAARNFAKKPAALVPDESDDLPF